ncbi:MAG: hypothetical protein IIV05_01830 [Ruminococcus sp.]|nr:hypothetical protein [Ruminococcus sp.]MBQ2474864.1 hypothetical protein [Ruminococcus sp.]MBQ5640524.1 hypothetical protein [Ruminococcus sp.]MBQ5743493.1 hypothetical protein [Ruminococcus sp.]
MPFINIKTNAALSQEKKGIIKRRLFDCISVIPGKSDRYLMVALEDGLDMAFHRESDANIAFTEVKIFGGSTKDAYQKLTAAICNILSDEADISGECCYVKFEETKYWGYNGFMF